MFIIAATFRESNEDLVHFEEEMNAIDTLQKKVEAGLDEVKGEIKQIKEIVLLTSKSK